MSKLHFTIFLLGLSLFLWDISYGIGWIFGWVFITLLRIYREPILEKIIGDFKNFSARNYIIYLLGVMVWIAIPPVISLLAPNYISAFAIFGAYVIDRILMFVTKSFSKEE